MQFDSWANMKPLSFYELHYLRPLLVAKFGAGALDEHSVKSAVRNYNDGNFKGAEQNYAHLPLKYLKNNTYDYLVLDFKKSLDELTTEEKSAWYQNALKTLAEAGEAQAKAEHLVKNHFLLTPEDYTAQIDAAELSPVRVLEHFLRAVGNLDRVTNSSIPQERQDELHALLRSKISIIKASDIDKVMAESKKKGIEQAKAYIEETIAALDSSDPRRLAYADALAESERQDMAFSANSLDRFKAGLASFSNPLATFQQRLHHQAQEADKAGGVRIVS